MSSIFQDFPEWSVDRLGLLSDDGLEHELLDGVLHVSPLPTLKHQAARCELLKLLDRACPAHLLVLGPPVQWQPDPRTSLCPDVMVLPLEALDRRTFSGPLTLAVEVLAPATRYRDLTLKRAKYAGAGVGSYWVVDPEVPAVLAADLVDGGYQVVGEVEGDQRLDLEQPFGLTLTPLALVSRWRRFAG